MARGRGWGVENGQGTPSSSISQAQALVLADGWTPSMAPHSLSPERRQNQQEPEAELGVAETKGILF